MKRVSKIAAGILIFLTLPFLVFTQSLTQNIRGTVRDADTQLPLTGVKIMIPTLKLGAHSDEKGNFKIVKVPLGRHDLKIAYMGYEEQTLPNLLLSSGKEVVLNLNLIESIVEVEEVVITANNGKNTSINELSVVSTRAFTVEETKRYAGNLNDPSRMALSFAGVSGGESDEENEIIIRGNSPRMMLWRVEGVEVPSPNHFSEEGASSGAVSILSTNMLANSDFSTGAFPSEYGNALSGVFDIRLRKGNNEQREYALSAGVLGLDFSAEGPFKKGKDASFLMNYRYSSLALLQKAGLNIVGDAVPVFQDLSFKVNLPTDKFGTFSIFGLGGLSHIEENEFGLLADSTEGELYRDRYSSDMGVFGINHKLVIGTKTLLSSAISTSASKIKYQWQPRNEKGEFPIEETEDFLNLSTRVQTTLTHKFNSRNLLKVGAIYSRIGYDMLVEYLDDEQNKWVTNLDDKGSANVFQGFLSWRLRLSEKITFNAGLHSMYFDINKKYTLEPRASLKFQLNDQQYISAGFGIHSRRDGLSLYLAQKDQGDGSFIQPNRNLDFTKAIHYVLGYDVMFSKDLHMRIETYYQSLYDVPVFDDSSSIASILNSVSPFTTTKLVNEGTGENYGVELTLEKFFSNNYYFLFTSSLYQSKYKALDGIERNTRFNGNYVNNFLIGKEFPVGKNKNNLIITSVRGIWAGGKRYIPIDEAASKERGYTVRDWENAYDVKTNDYFRADLSISFVINKKTTTQTIKFDIQNVTNHSNVINIYYSPRADKLVEARRGSIIPVLSYKLQF